MCKSEFKDDDDYRQDPTPEMSLFLPDCTIGGINGEKFNIKGKDAAKGKVGASLAMNHELAFKAHTPINAEKWSVQFEASFPRTTIKNGKADSDDITGGP